MTNFDIFIGMLKKYAEVYEQFEKIQKDKAFDFMPETGDQKTGLIGEAFIFEYLKMQGHPGLEFGGPVQEVWDIKYRSGSAVGGEVLVQVKTFSAYAKRRIISSIRLPPSGDYVLYLASLNEQFIPDNIWKLTGPATAKIKVRNGQRVISRIRMPKNDQDFAIGFTGIENIFDDFKRRFPELYPNG
jgi:hypothetical protein